MKFSPSQILIIGFISVILIGAIILSLPFSSSNYSYTNFIDALFTATSSVCVTGLIVVNTAAHWSVFGKIIIMMLIQIGGLGYMTLATLFAIVIGKQVSLKDRLAFVEGIQTFSFLEIKKFIIYVVKITLIIEFIGALFLSIKWIPEFGLWSGIGYSIFHSISAFCNAGFTTFDLGLIKYLDSINVNLTITTLIIIGGIGFIVLSDLFYYKKTKRLLLHSKIVLKTTFFLIFLGTILIFIFEYSNSGTFKILSLKSKMLASYFQSITTRTAGFNTVDISLLTVPTMILMIAFMFIGASPSGTGGGIKTTTFTTLLASIKAMLKGKKDVSIFRRTIPVEIVQKSYSLFILSIFFIFIITLFLVIIEGKDLIRIVFEVVSAFATCGLSTAVGNPLSLSSLFTPIGKLLIIITMFIGRLGPLTVAIAVIKEDASIKYVFAEEKIAVG
ncbi:MAG: hypothetical protein A2474_03360 [Elusimicrobia bacterium RIFOXYC2_FULL_34_12]|nr:MAG: hypothetical protein A2474_03360 [Elusimicrobia bacterium RIFOXYC2_FULL_34_12]OGS37885.1 MAG: hypothetical protein A2551_01575 [Elusimicrobia bacterium RIFOXYD2_FULL_34_30]HAM37947.1 Trk family potassium uptake protein [Elusimicrobiota bacterium]